MEELGSFCKEIYSKFYLGAFQNYVYHFGGPQYKVYSILGSILGYPCVEKLPSVLSCGMAKSYILPPEWYPKLEVWAPCMGPQPF